jgi:glycosyltransferase involved in cell wall biosynthesis
MLPIGVVIPTRNSMKFLPAHLAALKGWIEQAREVICVDSFSTDGTLEMLKAELHHPRLKILSHPPGLYESWNFAVKQVTSAYIYIATAGDGITLQGLRHLVETAERFQTDLVLSPPFITTWRPLRFLLPDLWRAPICLSRRFSPGRPE